MSLLSALKQMKQQTGSLDELASLPQTMIMQMAQSGQIPKEQILPILNRKAELADIRARTQAVSKGDMAPMSVMEQLMARNAQAEQPQQMADTGVAQLPIREDMYDEQRMAGGGIVAFRNNLNQPVDENMPTSDRPEFNSPEYNRMYGAPGSLARKVESIKGYYQSPFSYEGFKRGFANTLNAIGPYGAAEKIAAQPILGLAQKADIGLGVGRSALRANTLDTAYRASGAQDLPEVISKAYYGTDKSKAAAAPAAIEPVEAVKKPANSPSVDSAGNVVVPAKAPEVKKDAAAAANLITDQTNTSAVDEYIKILKAQGEDSANARKEAKYMRLLEAGLGIMGGTSPYAFTNIGQGAIGAAKGYAEDIKGMRAEERDRAKTLGALGMEKEKLAITKQHYENVAKLGAQENLIRQAMVNKTPDQIRIIERYMSDPAFAKAFGEMSADKRMTALDQIIAANAQGKGKPLNRDAILAEVNEFLKNK
jgi:hypothetical protein